VSDSVGSKTYFDRYSERISRRNEPRKRNGKEKHGGNEKRRKKNASWGKKKREKNRRGTGDVSTEWMGERGNPLWSLENGQTKARKSVEGTNRREITNGECEYGREVSIGGAWAREKVKREGLLREIPLAVEWAICPKKSGKLVNKMLSWRETKGIGQPRKCMRKKRKNRGT